MNWQNVLNESLRTNLKTSNISSRPFAGPGSWLVVLVPFAVILSTYKRTGLYHLITVPALSTIVCIGLLASSLMFLYGVYRLKQNYHGGDMIFPTTLTFILLCFWLKKGFIFGCVGAILIPYACSNGILTLLQICPKCFTFGEAAVLVQSAILFLFTSVDNIYRSCYDSPVLNMDIATIILQVGFLGVSVICGSVYFVPALHAPFHFYTLSAVVLLFLVIWVLHILLQGSPVLWIIQLLFSDINTMWLVIYWVICCVVAVVAVALQIQGQQQATTVVRKSFHLLAVAVYIPGMVVSCPLLYLASGVMLAGFVALELLRVLRLPPLGSALQEGFAVYADEKDAGELALTPMYLLAGCSLPLWLHPKACSSPIHLLSLLSGVLAIGVGDTAASVMGSWLGRHQWPGTKKTVEGTLACILSQIMLILLLLQLGLLDMSMFTLVKTVLGVVAASILEAQTDQVDNLVLPLATYIMLT